MSNTHRSSLAAVLTVGSAVMAIGASFTTFLAVAQAQTSGDRAAVVGGALPGGAILSARSVAVCPVTGGAITAAPIGANGSFRLDGLAAGRYRLAVTTTTVPKQTQGATFGEKVNAGLHAAGSAIQQGASLRRPDVAPPASDASAPAETRSGINGINNGMPNRISMNLTVGRQNQRIVLEESGVEVDVGADGVLTGSVSAN